MTAHSIYIDIEAPYRRRLTQKWLCEVIDATLTAQKINNPV
jgi:hypothetical protein